MSETTFAVIQSGGKQYRVSVGDVLDVERFPTGKAKSVRLEQVILGSKGGSVEVGRPYVKGAYCEAEVVSELRGPKKISFKYIRREKAATKIGHRQNLLRLKIKSIHF